MIENAINIDGLNEILTYLCAVVMPNKQIDITSDIAQEDYLCALVLDTKDIVNLSDVSSLGSISSIARLCFKIGFISFFDKDDQ
jgi:hypothetical protein